MNGTKVDLDYRLKTHGRFQTLGWFKNVLFSHSWFVFRKDHLERMFHIILSLQLIQTFRKKFSGLPENMVTSYIFNLEACMTESTKHCSKLDMGYVSKRKSCYGLSVTLAINLFSESCRDGSRLAWGEGRSMQEQGFLRSGAYRGLPTFIKVGEKVTRLLSTNVRDNSLTSKLCMYIFWVKNCEKLHLDGVKEEVNGGINRWATSPEEGQWHPLV